MHEGGHESVLIALLFCSTLRNLLNDPLAIPPTYNKKKQTFVSATFPKRG